MLATLLIVLLSQARPALAVNNGMIHQLPAGQYNALVDLYNSTNGASWYTKTGWLNPNATSWAGVTVSGVITDQQGNVTTPGYVWEIRQFYNNLTGTLPASIGSFPSMRYLNLAGNDITGSLPASIGNLTQLYDLDLAGNDITGSLPASIGNLTQLYDLDLGENDWSGPIPSTIGNLTSLFTLNLSTGVFGYGGFGIGLTGEIPASIGNLTSLRTLDLSGHRLTGTIPASLGNLTDLRTLYLAGSDSFSYPAVGLSGAIPASLGNLIDLSWFDLSHNRLSGQCPAAVLARAPDLRYNFFTLDTAQIGQFAGAGLPPSEYTPQKIPMVHLEPWGTEMQAAPLRWEEAGFFPFDHASLKATNNESTGPIRVTLESQNPSWLKVSLFEIGAPGPGPTATVELPSGGSAVFHIHFDPPAGSDLGEYIGEVKANYGGGVTTIPVNYKYSTEFRSRVRRAVGNMPIAGAVLHLEFPSGLVYDVTTGADGYPNSTFPAWEQGIYKITAEADGFLINEPVEGTVEGIAGFWPEVLLQEGTRPMNGTMTLAPASPLGPNTNLTVSFAGWVDVSQPLTYEVLVDDVVVSARGAGSSRTFNGPAAVGLHVLKGRIYDNLNNMTERAVNFTVKLLPEIVVEQPAGTSLTDGTSSISFDSASVGFNNLKTLTIRNTGTANLTGLYVTTDGASNGDFGIGYLGVTTLAPGASTTFDVIFTPSALGARTAAIQVFSNDADESPFDIAVSGTGLASSSEIDVQEPVGTSLADGISSISHGTTIIGFSAVRTITVRNTGTANLTGLAVTKDGTASADFGLGALGQTTLIPGASTTFDVTFMPSATGSRTAVIHIASSDADENPFDIALSGIASASTANEFTGSGGISIPSSGNATPYPSTLTVSGAITGMSAVRVKLNGLSHTLPTDLDILLLAPNGAVAALMSDTGGSNAVTGINMLFDDAGMNVIPGTSTITSGTYRATNNGADEALPPGGIGSIGTSLAALITGGINGDWKLFVTDDSSGNGGSISSWSLEFVTPAGDTTAPAGGTMRMTPASLVQASVPLTVAFTGWTDVSAPVSYTVLLDDIVVSAQGSSTSRSITAPVTPGVHTLKGRISDAQNNMTEVTQNFIVAAPEQGWRNVHEKWIRHHNGPGNGIDGASEVVLDGSGNVIVAGYSTGSGGNLDYYTAKYAAADGELLWERRYNGPGNNNESISELAVDGSGDVIVTGTSNGSTGFQDYYTAKYAATDGALIWERRYNGPANGGDFATAMVLDASGNVVVTGQSQSSGSGTDYYTAKYAAADGALLWERRYNGPLNREDYARAVAVDGSSNVIVTGTTQLQYGNQHYTAKYAAADGSLIWESYFDAQLNKSEAPSAMAVDSSGNVIVTGFFRAGNYTFEHPTDKHYYSTAKFAAATGALVWSKSYHGPVSYSLDHAYDVVADSAGSVIVTGYSLGADSSSLDTYTAKYAAANGALLWEKRSQGSPGALGPGALALDGNNNVVLTGSANTNYSTAKYAAANGALIWEKLYNGVGNGNDNGAAVAVDGNGNVVVTGASTGSGGNSDITTIYYVASPGSPDLTFSTDGVQTTPISVSGTVVNAHPGAVARQADGKLVVAGYAHNGTNNDFALVRYMADGSVDTSFGTSGTGVVMTPVRSGDDYGSDVVIQADGKIIVVGTTAAPFDMAAVRYLPNGTLDTSYGNTKPTTDGKAIIPIFGHDDYCSAAVLQPDGKLVMAGTANSQGASGYDTTIVRLTVGGEPDILFDGDGKRTVALSAAFTDEAYDLLMMPDGKIVVAGRKNVNASEGNAIYLGLNADGSPNNSFGTSGQVEFDFGGDDAVTGLALSPDGCIAACGYASGATTCFMARLTAAGAWDNSFDGDGRWTASFSSGTEGLTAVIVQPDGRLVASGRAHNGSNLDMLVTRLNADGTFDFTFDGDGRMTLAPGPGIDTLADIIQLPDGALLAAGRSDNASGVAQLSVLRLLGGPNELLVNGGFEANEALGGGMPTAFGDWRNEQAQMVTAENGVTPFAGTRMLEFTGTAIAGGSTDDTSAVVQHVPMDSYSAAIAQGGVAVSVGARFNRIAATDSQFLIELVAYNGTASSPGTVLNALSQSLLTDDDPATWEALTCSISLPVGTTMLAVYVSARENLNNNPSSPEFDGNYADAVTLTVTVGPDIQVEQPVGTVLADGTATVNFGTTPLGTPVTSSFKVTNTGGAALNVTGLTLPSGYEHVGTFAPYTLAPNAAHSFEVRFLANTVIGSSIGTLTLTSNDADAEGIFTIGLTGYANYSMITEPWVQRYNGTSNQHDSANSVAVDSSGNAVITGSSPGTGTGSDYYTAKYAAADGVLLWERRYNGTGNNTDTANSLAVDSSGNVVVTGRSVGSGSGSDYYTAKYAAADGALLWERRYNGSGNNADTAYSVAVDTSGNVVVTGQSTGSGTGHDYYTAKYAAADGTLLWEKRYNGTGNSDDTARRVAVDTNGNVVVTGESFNGSNNDYYTAKYAAADGALLWERRYNGTGNLYDEALSLAIDTSGNVVVTGQSTGNGTGYDYYTAKYAAANGGLMWERRYNAMDTSLDTARSVAVDTSGNVVVTGSSPPASGSSYDYYTAKYAAADGALLWEKRYDGMASSNDIAYGVVVDSSGNAVVTGASIGSGVNSDYYTAKYAAADGALLWEKRYNGTGNTNDEAFSLAVAASGDVVVTGWSHIGSNYDYATVIYRQEVTAPTVVTQAATHLAGPNFTLHGTVNPNGVTTSAWFEVGLTTSYGVTTPSLPIGYGTSAVPFSAAMTMPPGQTYHYRLVAQNGAATAYGADMTFTTPSNNANLSALTLSSGTLNPAFAPNTIYYTASVSNTVTSLTVTPTAADPNAFFITVNNGPSPAAIPLNVGSNTITINVTAQDQIMTRSYTVTVTRAASSNADLSSLFVGTSPLVPAFQSHITSYAVSVPNNATTVDFGGAAADPTAIAYPSAGFGPFGASFAGSLTFIGQNSTFLMINVHAQDITIKSYTVQITRQTAYETWAATSGLPSGATATGDHDGDGLTNFLEWAAGLSPISGSTLSTPAAVNGGTMEFIYPRSLAAVNAGAIFTVEWSDTLPGTSWSTAGVSQAEFSNNGSVQQMRATLPAGSQGRRFVHLRVVGP